MVYRVSGGRSYVFQALRPDGGYEQLGTGAKDRELAKDIEYMWGKLARKRAWDLLRPVLSAKRRQRTKLLVELFDLWTETDGDIEEIRQRKKDRDIEPLVAEWKKWYRGEVRGDTVDHAVPHVRWLLPEGTPRLVSAVTTDWLTERLTAYEGKRNTRRKVHSSWSGLFGYLAQVHKLWPKNPMDDVPRPSVEVSPIRFYEQDVVDRIVAWQPTEQRRALFAFLYGTAADVSILPRLTRRDFFDLGERLVRAEGTKTSTRDRVARIADWAWPIVWGYVSTFLPDARPWGDLNRWTISDWHRQTVGWDKEAERGLNLPQQWPLQCARDHWAVMRLRSGASVQVVAAQLGHGDPNLTFRKYGRFLPNALDRARMERQVQEYEVQRQQQQS